MIREEGTTDVPGFREPFDHRLEQRTVEVDQADREYFALECTVRNLDFGDVFSTSYALYQVPPEGREKVPPETAYTAREMEILAERVETEFNLIEATGKIEFYGVQKEVIYLEVDAGDWAKIGLTADQLRQLLGARLEVHTQVVLCPDWNDGAELDRTILLRAPRPL